MTIRPFADADVDAAAELLSRRHERHREAEPLVPDPGAPSGHGVVAIEGGEIAGYLVGEPRESGPFGKHFWIGEAGVAACEPELVRDLYAAAAQDWVDGGHARHFVLTPAVDDLVEVWFALGFGQQQIHAVRESGGTQSAEVRPGGPADLDAAAPLRPLIWDHQALSPVFAGVPRPSEEQMRADWEETLADPEVAYFVLERGRRLVGHALAYPVGNALNLSVVAILPEARGTGAGVALVEHVLAWAAEQGHAAVVADWRSTNLLSSRFFPRRGFRPTFLRLYRSMP